MSSKKIEHIYKDKLKDLEMNPSPAVWSKIEASLAAQKRAKRKVIFWYSSLGSSVAAILCLFFFNYPFSTNTQTTTIASKKESLKKETSIKPKEEASKTSTLHKNKKVTPTTTFKLATVASSKNRKETTKKIVSPTKETTITPTPKTIQKVVSKISETPPMAMSLKNQKAQKTVLKDSISTIKKSLKQTLLAEKEEAEKPTKKKLIPKKIWSIAPVISQYLYNSFSNKSTLDNRLNDAKKSGQATVSYGFNVAYHATKKLRIKTGVHKITMAQNTQNQSFNTSFSRISSFQNSTPKPVEIKTSSVETTNKSLSFSDVSSAERATIQSPLNTNTNSELEQRFGYIEIPLELNYEIYHAKKFSLYVSGGFSTLFLTENNHTLINDLYSESLGEVSNLNNLNFSLNFGTDIEYHLSKKWFLNLYPSIKIQTQTFSKDNNNPYLLGISTGLNYKF